MGGFWWPAKLRWSIHSFLMHPLSNLDYAIWGRIRVDRSYNWDSILATPRDAQQLIPKPNRFRHTILQKAGPETGPAQCSVAPTFNHICSFFYYQRPATRGELVTLSPTDSEPAVAEEQSACASLTCSICRRQDYDLPVCRHLSIHSLAAATVHF
ncbi:hypothetical protein DL93DRAFT_1334505 [Clavulina sp. PMI_390]|nr:hypothetical protein DL93DRAFT_1334505 [Clavulina sp. PMI_390]